MGKLTFIVQGICTILFIQTSLAVTTEIPPTNSAASTLGSLYRSARDYRSEREPNPRCLKCALGALGYGDESRYYDRDGYGSQGYGNRGYSSSGYDVLGYNSPSYNRGYGSSQGYDTSGYYSPSYGSNQGYSSRGGYEDRNWYYQPEDRYKNSAYDNRYDDRNSNRYDDRYRTRPSYTDRYETRYTNDYRGNGYDNRDPMYETSMRDGYNRGRNTGYDTRTSYYGNERDYDRYGYPTSSSGNFRPYDETYRYRSLYYYN